METEENPYCIENCPFFDRGTQSVWCTLMSSECSPYGDFPMVVLVQGNEVILPRSVARFLKVKFRGEKFRDGDWIEYKTGTSEGERPVAEDYRLCSEYQHHIFQLISGKMRCKCK